MLCNASWIIPKENKQYHFCKIIRFLIIVDKIISYHKTWNNKYGNTKCILVHKKKKTLLLLRRDICLPTYAFRAFLDLADGPADLLHPPPSILRLTKLAPLLSSPLSSSPPYRMKTLNLYKAETVVENIRVLHLQRTQAVAHVHPRRECVRW